MNPALEAICSLIVWAFSLLSVGVCLFSLCCGSVADGGWFYATLFPAICGVCWILCRATSNRGW